MVYLDGKVGFGPDQRRTRDRSRLDQDQSSNPQASVCCDAIFDAAIELFGMKGFDETTVEEVAQAAGVSRASFFRYFSSKDDLLAQNVIKYGAALTAAIKASPPSFTPLEIMRETVGGC